MVLGVQKPFLKELEIVGVGFKASISANVLDLSLGYSHPIRYTIPQGAMVSVPDATKIRVESPSKFLAGQVAADIKRYYPVEPYKGKGVKIVGEFVRRKEGKKTS
jgi:large subunit ribosomal protein L6